MDPKFYTDKIIREMSYRKSNRGDNKKKRRKNTQNNGANSKESLKLQSFPFRNA